MKKAFAVIILLALVLTGCYSRNRADPTGTEAFQINSHPTFSTEATEVTEGLDDKETEDKLIPTETEATSGKDNSTDTTDPVEKPTDSSTPKPDPSKPQENDEQSQTKPTQESLGTARVRIRVLPKQPCLTPTRLPLIPLSQRLAGLPTPMCIISLMKT